MRLRVTWEGGGWESDHFETSVKWLEKESADLDQALSGASEGVNVELVGGDALVTRAWNNILTYVGYEPADPWSTDQVAPLFQLAHYFYRSTGEELSKMVYAASNCEDMTDELDNLPDDLEQIINRDDPDYGTVYIAESHEDLDEAYWQLFVRMALHWTPAWLDRCIDREKAIGLLKEWNCFPIQSGGKWYVAQDQWQYND